MLLKQVYSKCSKKTVEFFNGTKSIFLFNFISLFFLSVLLLGTSSLVNYFNTRAIESRNYLESIESSHKLILRLVNSYNTHIASLYERIDQQHIKGIFRKLESYEEIPLKKRNKFISKIAKEEDIRVELLDYKTKEVLYSSKIDPKKYNEITFPETEKIYTTLTPEEPHFRFTMPDTGKKTVKLFVRKKSNNPKYLWRLIYRSSKEKNLGQLISFLKRTKLYEPLISRTGMYSSPFETRHGIDALPFPNDIESKLDETSCTDLHWCELWTKIDHKQKLNKDSYISYVGVKYSADFLNNKLARILQHLYFMIFISLIISLIISFFLSKVFSYSIYNLLSSIKNQKKNLNSNSSFPKVKIKELNELSSAFTELLEALKEKRKQARDLAKDILNIADKERREISRDLHDSVGQLLIAANFKIDSQEYQEAEKIILTASEELRGVYDKLEPRSLEKMSLERAVEWYLLKFFPKSFAYYIEVSLADSFEKSLKLQIYRIIQECIANVKKHALNCSFIEIVIEKKENFYYLKINNDFEEEKCSNHSSTGRGLQNIILRAESFDGELSVLKSDGHFEINIRFSRNKKDT